MKHNPERLEKAAKAVVEGFRKRSLHVLPTWEEAPEENREATRLFCEDAIEAYTSHDPLGLARELAGPDMVMVPRELTPPYVIDACLTHDHSYGLMSEDEQSMMMFLCREWWKAIIRAVTEPSATTRAMIAKAEEG